MADVRIGNRTFNGIEGVVLNNKTSGSTLYSLMDWNENSNSRPNYVKNRPFWIEEKILYSNSNQMQSIEANDTITEMWPEVSNIKCFNTNYKNFVPELMVGGVVTINISGTETTYNIVKYCPTENQLAHFLSDYAGTNNLAIVNGMAFSLPSTCFMGIIPITATTYIKIFTIASPNLFAANAPEGLYIYTTTQENNDGTTTTYQLTSLKFNDIIFNKDYQAFFDYFRNPMYILPIKDLMDVVNQDTSGFKAGDLILLTTSNPMELLS